MVNKLLSQLMNKPYNDKRLLREIIFVLVIKVIVLFAIWHLFFDEQTPITIDNIAEKIISDPQQGASL